MPFGTKELMAKAKGFTVAIDAMEKSERAATPNSNFGEDYNRLRAEVAKGFPDLDPLLPPSVIIKHNSFGPFTDQTYGEIRTFCEQMYQILAEQP